ncbi:thioredoxin domain-containing protein [Aequorivita echinoideorum]|uniref:Thioredoxin domain-containing protein n=1 Tax=Aequorivita echinoideorum TaxID=1549647 RepID=A0ABS5S5P7_9FLAO|nr:thioredoxin domain-containing protein [Aequorivita echinoideorum]MBT0607692.1 thioredoxin domain-containing protein [Aequorivita echinoideorum]
MENPKFTNQLINESSPYLLQHAHNPVNWKPWNQSSLYEAKEKNSLIIVSIGYAACHWCHVMEHESFENTEVAKVMNADYISIKVDREERPDVDQTYINAVQLMTGSAGWPLNVVTLPDGRPIWGGTYFKKNDWVSALQQINSLFKSDPQRLYDYAESLADGIKKMDFINVNTENELIEKFHLYEIVENWKQQLDKKFGGQRGSPKFMMPNNLEFLLRFSKDEKDKKLSNYVELTLQKMAFGGIYDQVGGGFSRYSVDEKWHVPHFEKMLYDNAQLVSLYSHAFSASKNMLYQQIVEETLQFITNEMMNKEGCFYSSLDADSVDAQQKLEEGAYYTFKKNELEQILNEDFEIFSEYYNVNEFGKWETDKYVLIRKMEDSEIAEKFQLTEETLRQKKEFWKKLLLNFRNKREKPRLDDKSLTSWNALIMKGFVDAYKVFGNEDYKEIALTNAAFISEKQISEDGKLWHTYKNGKSTITGFLEDYAATMEAFISLYQITIDEKWLKTSKKLADYCLAHFFDREKQFFYFTSSTEPAIIARNFEYRDNVVPSSNSIMAKNLFILSKYFEDSTFAKIAEQMLKNVLPEIERYPSGFSNWLDLLQNFRNDFFEIVVVGKNALEKIEELNRHFLPNAVIAGSVGQNDSPLFKNRFQKDKTLIYVCKGNACKLPVEEIEKAIQIIKEN